MRRHTERRVPSVADELRRDTKPAHEEIAARAHQRYLDRGAIDGSFTWNHGMNREFTAGSYGGFACAGSIKFH